MRVWLCADRFVYRGFIIGFFANDHRPAHVHARKGLADASFLLNCEGGFLELRENNGVKPADLRALKAFIAEKQGILCEAWEKFYAQR